MIRRDVTRRLALRMYPVLLCVGCQSARMDYMSSPEYQARLELQESLFPGDQAVLSNEAIEQILSTRVVLPDKGRIAILRYGDRTGRRWWSDEVARLDRETAENLVARLRSSPRIADAALLPSLLTPREQSVPHLRAAAARYQADLLLIYRAASDRYEKQRLLGSDETRAYCTVEAVLLDTRTGIIPFTSVVVQDYTAKKSGEDLDLAETARKAELKALGQALDRVAGELVEFLSNQQADGA